MQAFFRSQHQPTLEQQHLENQKNKLFFQGLFKETEVLQFYQDPIKNQWANREKVVYVIKGFL